MVNMEYQVQLIFTYLTSIANFKHLYFVLCKIFTIQLQNTLLTSVMPITQIYKLHKIN